MAAAYDTPVVPHGSGVFSSHFQMAFTNTPFQEVLAISPDGNEIVPVFGNLIQGEPLPVERHDPPARPPRLGHRDRQVSATATVRRYSYMTPFDH